MAELVMAATAHGQRSPCGVASIKNWEGRLNAVRSSENVSRPGLSDQDQHNLRAFWGLLEQARSQIEREEHEAASHAPALAAVVSKLEGAPNQVAVRDLQRQALLDGQWEPLLQHLAARGTLYARLALSFRSWYALLAPLRRVVQDRVFETAVADPVAVLRGLERFMDIVTTAIGSAYLDAREAETNEAESQLGLYVAMFRNAPVGMLLYDWADPPDLGSFRLMAANPMAAELGSAPVPEHIGRTLNETSPHVLATEVPRRFAAAIEAREAHAWTVENLGRIHEVRSFPLHGSHLGVIFDDVTVQRQMAAEIERQIAELERSNRELDDFAYVASHDLKAPLRDIDNLAKWVIEDARDLVPEASKRHLTLLQERIARMERLLDDLLAYSRAGRVSVPVEEFALNSVIDEALHLIEPGESWKVSVHGDALVVLRTPRVPLGQIMRNLIQNAIKHHHRDHGEIQICLRDADQFVDITVSDDGPGIAHEFQERVFRMFHTLRPRDEVEGSGMGLAIVKKLVESHAGSVQLESGPGSGANVHFTWPKQWPLGKGRTT